MPILDCYICKTSFNYNLSGGPAETTATCCETCARQVKKARYGQERGSADGFPIYYWQEELDQALAWFEEVKKTGKAKRASEK